MRTEKVHTYGDKKAWFTPTGRLWHVQDGAKQVSFEGVEEMLKDYPELVAVPAIEAAAQRQAEKRQRAAGGLFPELKKEAPEKNVAPPKGTTKKLVTCFYCSGKGKTSSNMPCPNCGGKGTFVVTGKSIWD